MDKQLCELINTERHEAAKDVAMNSEIQSIKSHNRNNDMLSQRTGASVKSVKPRIYHTDPALELNPTEEQWNAIVLQNLKKFEKDKKDVKVNQYEKTKKIQLEQLV